MKGTTLTELNKAYLRQGRFIAGRYIHAKVKYFRQRTDAIFFEHELAADKHRPRGKAYLRLMEIENLANTMKFKALQEKIRQREASNAGN
ncbi:TPA: hypothetical protein ACKRC9_000532 [Proteus mirabilis]